MYSNNYKQNCGCGCGGSGSCGRAGGQNDCEKRGPFIAIDQACIVPSENAITGSIIPFSSGITPVILGVVLGAISLPWQVGFGSAVPGVAVLGNTIDLSTLITEEFTVPRAGNITAMSASFKETLGLNLLGNTATINARVYKASGNSSVFTATDASVDLVITGPISIGQVVTNSATFAPIPVAKDDRLVMVYSITLSSGLALAVVFTGTASAGITID